MNLERRINKLIGDETDLFYSGEDIENAILLVECTRAIAILGIIQVYSTLQFNSNLKKYIENEVAKVEVFEQAGEAIQTTRVGRWMSQAEYDTMVKTGKVQMFPNGNTTYVANPADANAFKAASNGSIYVEFDVPTNSIYSAGNKNWGQIAGPGSLMDRLNQSKGLPPISGMPDATNINIVGGK